MKMFIVQIEFSDDVAETVRDIADQNGTTDASWYLERLLEKALDGGHFANVTVAIQDEA